MTFGYYFPATQEGAADMRRNGVAMRRKTSKPDVDNIGKNLLDCMTRAGFFTDDSAVALIHAEKFEITGRPRISVLVRQLAEYPGGLFAPVEVEGRRNAQEGRRGSRTGEDARTGRGAILGPFPWLQSAFPARQRRRRRRIDYDSRPD